MCVDTVNARELTSITKEVAKFTVVEDYSQTVGREQSQ